MSDECELEQYIAEQTIKDPEFARALKLASLRSAAEAVVEAWVDDYVNAHPEDTNGSGLFAAVARLNAELQAS